MRKFQFKEERNAQWNSGKLVDVACMVQLYRMAVLLPREEMFRYGKLGFMSKTTETPHSAALAD